MTLIFFLNWNKWISFMVCKMKIETKGAQQQKLFTKYINSFPLLHKFDQMIQDSILFYFWGFLHCLKSNKCILIILVSHICEYQSCFFYFFNIGILIWITLQRLIHFHYSLMKMTITEIKLETTISVQLKGIFTTYTLLSMADCSFW